MQPSTTLRLDKERALFELADQQAGYFTSTQAGELGYSYRAQSHHKSQGNWCDEGWGIYRLRNYPQSADEELVRLSLWSRNRQGRPQAVVSHDSALQLYELTDLLPAKIHLSVPPSFRKAPSEGVVIHKARFEAGDLRQRSGYQVTSPLRTLLDVAVSHVSPEHVEQAVYEALERGLVRRKPLERAVGESPRKVQERLMPLLDTL
ncbi:hypothetical protein BH24DEI2_BH24DEI2_10530 [soil metagenome]